MKSTVRTATQAFWIDAGHGGTQEHYGEQLRRWRHAFAATGGEPGASGVTLDPLHFALAAWEVATRPVADSPYVRTHPRVLDAACHRAEDGRAPLAVVELATPPPVPLPDGWSSWRRQGEQPYAAGAEGTPTALSTLELRIPLSGDRLPTPTRPRAEGLPNLDDAQASLEAFVAELNAAVTPFLRELDGAEGVPETGGATLVQWLRTQIEADKATAEAAGAGPWRYLTAAGPAGAPVRQGAGGARRLEFGGGRTVTRVGFHDDDLLHPVEAIHIALHDPADAIARCGAELALLNEHTPPLSAGDTGDARDAVCPLCGEAAGSPCQTLRHLAYGYRLRPGWRPEWSPAR
ncbi:DUF6221 family protein [Nonomuraea sp. NPDC001831]|uniref:DUF6221 family protein n=1 Tax=Nonomuraea sp. NPDC001831 TaxID=3364340 RepID=UPI00367D2004